MDKWIQGKIRFETRELLKDRVPIDEKNEKGSNNMVWSCVEEND